MIAPTVKTAEAKRGMTNNKTRKRINNICVPCLFVCSMFVSMSMSMCMFVFISMLNDNI